MVMPFKPDFTVLLLSTRFSYLTMLQWTSLFGKPKGEGKTENGVVQGMGGEAAR